MANESRIYEQIEKEAGFYQPAVYELLTFYQSLENQQEPLDGQFVPMTTVQARSPQQTKIFAIGLIPPSSSVTGRLLDRSASVDALVVDESRDEEIPDNPPDNFLVRPNAGLVEAGRVSSAFGLRKVSLGGQHLGCDIAAELGSEVRSAKDGVVVSITADGVREGYGNTIIIQHADGTGSLYAHLNNFGPVSVGMSVAGGTVIGFVGQTTSGRPRIEPHLHFEVLQRVMGGGPARFDGIIANKQMPQRLEPTKWLSENGRSVASSKIADEAEGFQVPFTGDGAPATGWVASGSANANQASKTASQVAKRDMLREGLGERFQKGQQAMINMMTAALNRMANTPPLRLLVNPQSFKVSAEKLISDGNWGRSGPIIEHWGENQDKIEGSGKIAGFYSVDAQNANGPGLNRTARQFSTSYQNLLALWLIYKNNGGVSFPDPIVPKGSRAQNLAVVGSVYLYYDDILYIGSFDTFTLTEAADTPFTLEYSFAFTVRSWYVLDHQDDPQYMYGRPGTPPTPNNPVRKLTPYLVGLPISGSGSPTNNPQPSPEVALPADGLTSTLDNLFDRFALAELEEGG